MENYQIREPSLILIFFIKHTNKNKDDKGKQEILINNSGIRAINRQYLIFRTLGVESAEVEEIWQLAFK